MRPVVIVRAITVICSGLCRLSRERTRPLRAQRIELRPTSAGCACILRLDDARIDPCSLAGRPYLALVSETPMERCGVLACCSVHCRNALCCDGDSSSKLSS
jgi:hypothetical protein